MGFDWTLALWLLLTALLAALSALGVLMILQSRRVGVSRPLFQEDVQGTVFLFDGETLVDATPGGRALLATTPVRGAAWHRLMAFLSPRFPGLEARLAQLATEGRFTITCDGGGTGRPLTLEAEWRGGLSRLVLADSDGETPLPILDPLSHRAMEDELAMLRGTLTQAPLLVWRENAAGDVVWANAAYLMLAARQLDPEHGTDLAFAAPADDGCGGPPAAAAGPVRCRTILVRGDGLSGCSGTNGVRPAG